MVAQVFEDVAGFWVEGADLPPADREAAIDAAALAAYEAAAWASCVSARGHAA